ncbi:TfoX/Sxy family protein [Pseudoxanthomonas sp. 10H]|uniref:TfoX/Sxy family protein n=1 Tax=Pseudoxanthomonas sp. 10H TaxID=3242729 RepID=UPI0035585699
MSTAQLRNIGPKSAAWLRQVGLRSAEDLATAGAVQAFLKVRRAGFKPSLNLLYALEGALLDCHWHDVPEARRAQLLAELEAASAALPPARGRPVGGPVTTAFYGEGGGNTEGPSAQDAPAAEEDDGGNRFT